MHIKEKMQKLVNKYENRMREFVLKMAEKPIMIKKSKDKFSTSRQEFFALTSNKILDKKGFQFKSYKSDKERINELVKGKELLDKYLEGISKEKKRKEKLKKKKNIPKLIQPSMRFTARSDFERVYDIIKNRNALYEEEKIIKNQLAKMGFSSHIEDEDEENEESEKIDSEENLIKKENLTDEEWIKALKENNKFDIKKILIGNKLDLEDERQVQKEEAETFAESIGCKYYEGSAKTGYNISEALDEIARITYLYMKDHQEEMPRDSIVLERKNKNDNNEKKKKCC